MSTDIPRLDQTFKKGAKVPYGYSLIYCNPISTEDELGMDGFDNYHAPTNENTDLFRRRMWVAGSFTYNTNNPLRFGDDVSFTETVAKIQQYKQFQQIGIDYKRVYSINSQPSVTETRRLYYIQSKYETEWPPLTEDLAPDSSITVTPSRVGVFRASALVFNSHLIHYNPTYALEEENYPNIVVSAPLQILMALQYWHTKHSTADLLSFRYKILSPSFVDSELNICTKKLTATSHKLWMTTKDNRVCFTSKLVTA
ncbi:hypothetical protein OGAPHI_005906 [Ogataea philodendri]|uniref:Uncharacterized protein n=1 Tax=Ogataea philodendri TaxID=1378263 RepID=A0A9P8T0F6_9ASCO|nr:uncharacterized protein OGAPHI_005906 [Ogataea philodendri]KAH3661728.1 hypothetical protein OGAPHI_005906 [Ogataea philodendri]